MHLAEPRKEPERGNGAAADGKGELVARVPVWRDGRPHAPCPGSFSGSSSSVAGMKPGAFSSFVLYLIKVIEMFITMYFPFK